MKDMQQQHIVITATHIDYLPFVHNSIILLSVFNDQRRTVRAFGTMFSRYASQCKSVRRSANNIKWRLLPAASDTKQIQLQ